MEGLDELLNIEAEAILRKPFKYVKDDLVIEIKPVTVAQMIEINPFLINIKKEDWSHLEEDIKKGDISKTLEYMDKYLLIMSSVLNIIVGKDISTQITNDDMLLLFLATYKRIQGSSFLKSIDLIQKLSPNTKAGIIAACMILKN